MTEFQGKNCGLHEEVSCNTAEKYVRVIQDMNEYSMTPGRFVVGVTDGFNVEVGLHQESPGAPSYLPFC